MEQRGRLAGKRVLVTGAGTGIGQEVAREFAREGADVVLHYAHSGQGALEVVQAARAWGVRSEAMQADFGDITQVQRLGQAALEYLGGLDVLYNNAGITMNKPFGEVTVEQFDTLYNVNIRAMFFLAQACLPALRTSRGTIINTTSVHAFEGMREHSVYAGTKGAIVALTRQLAVELAPEGVRVNAIAPGLITVPNHFVADPLTDPEAAGKTIPAGFAGQPIDVARLAVFLASPDARYIVGQTIIVDGGTTAWMPFSDGFRGRIAGTFGKGYVAGI